MFFNFKKALFLALLLASNLSQASVWAPTNGDSNFFDLNTLIGLPSSFQFGIFDDNANVATDAPILTFIGGATVSFSQNNSNWNISSGTSTGILLGSYNFQIGYNRTGVWEAEQSSAPVALLGSSVWQLSFGQGQGNLRTLYAVDITPSSSIPEVPVPAAVWLMSSSLLGMLFVGRRKAV